MNELTVMNRGLSLAVEVLTASIVRQSCKNNDNVFTCVGLLKTKILTLQHSAIGFVSIPEESSRWLEAVVRNDLFNVKAGF